MALALGAAGLAVGHGQHAGVATGLAVAADRLAAYPLRQRRVPVALDEVEHLGRFGLGQAVAQAVIFHVAGQHMALDGALVNPLPLLVAGGCERVAQRAVAGLSLGEDGQAECCGGEPGGGAANRVAVTHDDGLRKAMVFLRDGISLEHI
ncbi:hypothetical protein [Halomonas sp. E19]|uniref:hypothetical protein n=1 Tax=Halomonas sp. E19 TaxID=3397247 RepID=UPI0040341C2F